jgi:N-acyl-D-aspartate/D-glutamate deacylase
VTPQITAVPITLLLRFDERSFLTAIPGWQEPLHGFFSMSTEDRKALLLDPGVRFAMKQGKADPKNPLTPDFSQWTFTLTPSRPELGGKTLAEAAAADAADPIDLLCDQVVADDLASLIESPIFNRHRDGAIRFLQDPYTLLGLGDAGAHVMSVTNYRYPTFLLAEIVLKREQISIELAINRMTQVPARLHGLSDRGELRVGLAADICVLDPERLELGPVEICHDLPGDGPRLVQSGFGYRAVFVNGVRTIDRDEPTGAAPGRMLRAGDQG